MFFDSWESLLRILLIGSLAYAVTIFLLRISGNRKGSLSALQGVRD